MAISYSHRSTVFTLALALGTSWTTPTAAFAGPPVSPTSRTTPDSPPPELVPAPEPPPPAPTTAPKSNRGLGLMIAGFSMFLATYALPVAISGELVPEAGRPLPIPLAGPFIAAPHVGTVGGGVLVGLFGVFQATGLSMGIAGAVIYGKSRRQARLSASLGGLQLRF